ncbi:putative glycosyl hydrolase 32 family protein [Lyophyllum shimeji]|uniref:Glycosyl hydrolase 32 family protein n=1 Tax=Lyophyllum shimeji TaxID=47721 RepID=A0A9P3UNZ1_LYOSH|nr:putative glycosyl hydrolase 32 family protein [Lyophyllum shimeji]
MLLPRLILLPVLSAAAISKSNAKLPDLDPTTDLNALPNNALFTRWRPRFHFLAPSGWLNDPCGAMYDPVRDTYHLFYQYHANHVDWGNMSWGHATSRDLVTWKDVRGWHDAEPEALGTGPNGTYDHLGIFSGTAQPVGLDGKRDGNLTVFYTSVQHLPTGWNRPYIPGTESQSLATSSDGGLTWQKYKGNPVLVTPPAGWNITGWRDPFFQPWPEMDAILKQKSPHYYVIFGSGIKGVGPRIPLYSAPASDLTKWTFLGALLEVGQNTSFGDAAQTGSYGFNFEVSGAFSLTESAEHGGDGRTVHHFITTGSEGGDTPFHPNAHWALWAEGNMRRRTNGSAQFDIVSSGVVDWGNLYAVTSFWDAKNNRRVSWGWSPEDMNNYGIKAEGFQGSMGLPHSQGKKIQGDHFELKARLANVTGSAGFVVRASPGLKESTVVAYSPTTETITVNRDNSSLIKPFANYPVNGHFAAYNISGSGPEPFDIHVFVDGSLVEVFVNDRFALTTRIYPSSGDALDIWAYVEGGSASFKGVQVWTDMANVWPERPANSSSVLVTDSPEDTGNGTWWSGN